MNTLCVFVVYSQSLNSLDGQDSDTDAPDDDDDDDDHVSHSRPTDDDALTSAKVSVFSERERTERELTFTFAICYRPSVCRLSSVCLSVTFVRSTQAAQIFGNISTALGTLAIRGHPLKILHRSSQGNPSAGGVEHKRGSKI